MVVPRLGRDRLCRAVTLWQHGLLDRLAPHIDHGIIACARDDGSWALLMRDLGPTLLAYVRFTAWENDAFLEAMAHLHATFWSAPELEDQGLGLCPMRAAYTMFAPSSGRRESASNLEIPQRIVEGWDLLPSLIAPDVAEILAALLEDPTPLCQALRRLPQTLNHGDWRHANQGLWRDDRRRVVLLDWQLATIAPPGLDLGRYLGTNSVLLPGSKEATIESYRRFLAGRLGSAFDDDWWRPQLALALLGGFLQDGWAIALKATSWHVGADARDHWRQDLLWWSQQVRAGAAFLRF